MNMQTVRDGLKDIPPITDGELVELIYETIIYSPEAYSPKKVLDIISQLLEGRNRENRH